MYFDVLSPMRSAFLCTISHLSSLNRTSFLCPLRLYFFFCFCTCSFNRLSSFIFGGWALPTSRFSRAAERQVAPPDSVRAEKRDFVRTKSMAQSELLFQVISDRSEKKSTIVTTNLPFSKWTDLFENDTMVSALVDRLTFHSHVLDMNGVSYRLERVYPKSCVNLQSSV